MESLRPLHFIILSGDGINCERETKLACESSSSQVRATILPVAELLQAQSEDGEKGQARHLLKTCDAVIFPGGFSYGDQLGSGKILALKIKNTLRFELLSLVERRVPILGICNGMQVLLHLGLLPDFARERKASLQVNASGKFLNRWEALSINRSSPCVWTKDLPDYSSERSQFFLPIRHKEGNLQMDDGELSLLKERGQVVLTYADGNPNGAVEGIAGLCDPTGLIFGMMPHPEANASLVINPPQRTGKHYLNGLNIFQSVVSYLCQQPVSK